MDSLNVNNLSAFQFGLIGYPLAHSLSPAIHTAALRACGLQGAYVPFAISPHDTQGLKNLLSRLRSGSLHGLNVTIPYKQTIIEYLDELTPTARAIGAVNTVFLRQGSLIGDNTDAAGFLSDLKRFLAEDQSSAAGRRSALVLGAGGSARAVTYALLNDGWQITLAARRLEQAQTLAASFPTQQVEITTFTNLPRSTFDLIVNATPLGMFPSVETSPLPEDFSLSQGTIVYDLVYNPRETRLVREAKAQGCCAITGLGMLVEQAALAFERWTGYVPPRAALYRAVDL